MENALENFGYKDRVRVRPIFYEPALGRFLQQDPHPGLIHSPLTINNKYIYAGNQPTLKSDPNGRFAIITAMVVGALIGGAIAEFSGGDFWEGAFAGAIIGASGAAGMAVGSTVGTAAGTMASSAAGGIFSSAAVVGGISTAASITAGILAGALAGAVTGAAVGGLLMDASGEGKFSEGAMIGAQLGYVSGGIMGGIGAANPSLYGVPENTALGKALTSKAVIKTITIASAGLPFGIYRAEYKEYQ